MRQKSFQQHATSSKFTLPAALLILLAGWVISLHTPSVTSLPHTGSALWKLLSTHLPAERPLSLGINLLLYLLIGFLLIPFNNKIAIIRTRASIHTSLFFFWSALLPILHPLQGESAATLILLASLLCFMAGYQHPSPMTYVYHSWLLAGFASCLIPEVLILIPIYLIGLYLFHILSFKNLVAGILGLAFSYLIFFFLAWALQEMPLVTSQLAILKELFTTYHFPPHEAWLNTLAVFHGLLLLIALFHYWFKRSQIKIRTRDFINFILLTEIALQATIYFKPGTLYTLLPVSLIGLSFIEGHFLTTVQTKLTNLLFIATLVTSIVLYGLILWRI